MTTKPESLSDFVGPSRDSGDQIVFKMCPVCGCQRYKTYLNPATGFWYCHAAEHSGGGVIDVGSPLVGQGKQVLASLAGHTHEHKWEEVTLPSWTELSCFARRYLRKRGIDDDVADRMGIVEMTDHMRVVVPYFGPSGGIIYWTARKYSEMEDGPKYLAASGRHPLYVLPGWQPSDRLVIVEGVFDAIAVHLAGMSPVLALGGKFLPSYLYPDLERMILPGGSVQIVLDSDALDASIKLRNKLAPRCHVSIVQLPTGEDPASMGNRIRETLRRENV